VMSQTDMPDGYVLDGVTYYAATDPRTDPACEGKVPVPAECYDLSGNYDPTAPVSVAVTDDFMLAPPKNGPVGGNIKPVQK